MGRKCVKMPLQFSNNKLVKSMDLGKGLMPHQELPSTNLDAERHLSVFGKRSPVAKFINKNVTTKGIRNDVTLFQSATFKSEISKRFLSIVKLLNDLETDWVDKQKQFYQLKILEKIKKGNQSKE